MNDEADEDSAEYWRHEFNGMHDLYQQKKQRIKELEQELVVANKALEIMPTHCSECEDLPYSMCNDCGRTCAEAHKLAARTELEAGQ